MRNVVTYQIYHRHVGSRYGPHDFVMCITQSDTFRYARLRYCLAFFGDGDGGRGHGAIAAWILQHQTASTVVYQARPISLVSERNGSSSIDYFYSKLANVTHAMRACLTCTRIF